MTKVAISNSNPDSENLATAQEHPMGCAVACVASLCRISYQEALSLFDQPENAWTRGFYCSEIVAALQKRHLKYQYSVFNPGEHSATLETSGTFVFIDPCPQYPAGHFFVKTENGWMNPWSNFPQMNPVKSDFQKSLPFRISYVIHAENGN